MVSTPFFLSSAAFSTKPGRCLAEQVGVKAPGRPNSTTFLPLKKSSVCTSFTPSGVICLSLTDGILSPTLMVMAFPFVDVGLQENGRSARPGGPHHSGSPREKQPHR